jgi:subtilisin family serine protease
VGQRPYSSGCIVLRGPGTAGVRAAGGATAIALGAAALLLVAGFAAGAWPNDLNGPGDDARGPAFSRAFPVRAVDASAMVVTPGRYIVVLAPGRDAAADVAPMAAAYGLRPGHVYRAALQGFSADIPAQSLDAIRRDPRILFLTPDVRLHASLQTLPTGIDRIEADRNRTARIDGADERVDAGIAILDTGADLDHPDLNIAFSRSFVAGEPTPDDFVGHGTHVAGTAAALDNAIGVVGVAPGARLYALKVLARSGSGTYADIIAAVDWVTENAALVDVASMSLGGFFPDADDGNCGRTVHDALHTAICASVAAGVTYVVAAGNERSDAKDFVPASYDEVLTVSALSDLDGVPLRDRITWFSNFGPDVDLMAPGRDIVSTWPGGTIAWLSGTSMATPHVSGAAALYAAHVRATRGIRAGPAEVAAALRAVAEPAPPGGWPGDSDGIPEPLLRVRDIPSGSPDAIASMVAARSTRIEADGESTSILEAVPNDASGHIVGPGLAVGFATTSGTMLDGVRNGGTDLYSQDLAAPQGGAGSSVTVSLTVGTVAVRATAAVHLLEDLGIGGIRSIADGPARELDPAVASNGDGFLVAWWSVEGSAYSVRAARLGIDGTRLNPTPLLLESATRTGVRARDPPPMPRVASDGTHYVVAWPGAGDAFDVRGAVVRASDGAVVSAFSIANPAAQYAPSVAFDGGSFLVAWYEFDSRSGRYDVLGAAVRPDGSVTPSRGSSLVPAASPAVWIGEAPGLAFDGTNYLVAWSRLQIGPCPGVGGACALDSDVWAARVTPSLGVLDPAGFPLSTSPRYDRFPAVASDGTRSLVAWESVDADPVTLVPFAQQVDAVRVAPGGIVLDPSPIRVAGPASAAFDPDVATLGPDRFVVAWTNGSHPDDWDVEAARIVGSTGAVVDPEGHPVSVEAADQFAVAVASSDANLIAAFQDLGRYAQAFADVSARLWRIEGPNRAPTVAAASASPSNPIAGQDVGIQATASDPDGDVLSYEVTFGDGSSATGTTPPGGGTVAAAHAFATPGSYSVSVRADDGKGGVATASLDVVVVRHAFLRAVTSPPVAGKVYVDGIPMDEWGLNWVKLAPGTHVVSFGDVAGLASPPARTVMLLADETSVVEGEYVPLASLRITTDPAVPGTISIDGVPRNDWGIWTFLAAGTYAVSFGAVAGFDPPAAVSVTLGPGESRHVVGQYAVNPAAPGPDPSTFGLLRVTTDPPVASTILVDGIPRNDWGLEWVKLPPGPYEVSFRDVYGATTPAPALVGVVPGATTVHEGRFALHGSLRVATSPAVPGTIFVNGLPRDDWGMWQSLLPGAYRVSFGPVPGYVTPAPAIVTVAAGATAEVVGTYVPAGSAQGTQDTASRASDAPGGGPARASSTSLAAPAPRALRRPG